MECLTPSKRLHLGEINKNKFDERNKIDLQTKSISLSTWLKLLSIDKKTYINAFRVNFNIPICFLQKLCKDIQTNPFGIHIGNLWQVNINVQFILDLMLIASYCTSYLTKIDKVMTKELKIIIISCYENKIETHIYIWKMGNDFLNA